MPFQNTQIEPNETSGRVRAGNNPELVRRNTDSATRFRLDYAPEQKSIACVPLTLVYGMLSRIMIGSAEP